MGNRYLSSQGLVLAALVCGIAAVASADPQLPIPAVPHAPPGYLLVSEELWAHLMDETGRHFDRARDAFLSGHVRASAAELRKAAIMMRIEASNTHPRPDPALAHIARQVEALAHDIQSGRSADSIDALDALSSQALTALAKHAQSKAASAWNMQQHRRSGQYLRAAADNLERAAFRARSQLTAAASGAIKNARVLSERLVDGTDRAVDGVAAGIETIGHQIEHFEHALLRRPD